MTPHPLLKNAGMSIAQVVVSGLVLFFLYRYLLATIGVAKLGIWSVVMATASVSRTSELGLSGSVVKFVAKYRAHEEMPQVGFVIQTAAISTAILLGLMLGLLFPFFSRLLPLVIPASGLADGLAILPYTLVSLWFIAVAGVFQSGLDGCQRIDLRSWIIMGGSVCYLLLTILLVPAFGLIGLALGQVLQTGIVLALSWMVLRREVKTLPPFPCRWSRALFKEMIGYGVHFQVIAIVGMLSEPVTKGLLSRFGGLAMAGYYEMASRMIVQLRTMIVSANQVLVPVIADLQEKTPDRIRTLYRESYRLLVYLSVPFFSLIMTAIPVVSELWIGAYEGTFVLFAMLLAVAWFLNLLISPAYFANMGTGRLRWNTVGHVVIGVLNLALGWLGGVMGGGVGVVLGWGAALTIGSGLILLAYHLGQQMPLRELVPEESRILLLASGFGAASGLGLYYAFHEQWAVPLAGLFGMAAYSFIVARFCWIHPLRGRLVRWLNPAR